jgi:hypothetical protein
MKREIIVFPSGDTGKVEIGIEDVQLIVLSQQKVQYSVLDQSMDSIVIEYQ